MEETGATLSRSRHPEPNEMYTGNPRGGSANCCRSIRRAWGGTEACPSPTLMNKTKPALSNIATRRGIFRKNVYLKALALTSHFFHASLPSLLYQVFEQIQDGQEADWRLVSSEAVFAEGICTADSWIRQSEACSPSARRRRPERVARSQQ